MTIDSCILFFFLYDSLSAAGSTDVCDPSTEVACRNYPNICIQLERVQDGVEDCPDASDEGKFISLVDCLFLLVVFFDLV